MVVNVFPQCLHFVGMGSSSAGGGTAGGSGPDGAVRPGLGGGVGGRLTFLALAVVLVVA